MGRTRALRILDSHSLAIQQSQDNNIIMISTENSSLNVFAVHFLFFFGK